MFNNIPQKCQTCSNKQYLYDDYRCARYHLSLCDRMYSFCQGKYYINVDDGISLYALKAWLETLSKEELELPLIFDYNHQELIPLFVIRTYKNGKDHWRFHTKNDKDNIHR